MTRSGALSVQRAGRAGPAAAGADPVRGAPRDRRRADPRREGHREVDGGARRWPRCWPQVDDGARLVELPIGATEDRVVGSLDLQKVLRDGEHAFSPGLLARAHGGVLYVDEVNLLHDHLVDVLLDAAAMGRVHIERDGVSHTHDARFVLVGTMNPEEGELRPQLLDRFGLTVDVRASRDVDVRVEVIRARMAFEADPAGFAARYADDDAELARRDRRGPCGRRRCGVAGQRVTPDRGAVRGLRRRRDARRSGGGAHRGGARGLAWGSDAVEEQDIRVAAELALPHRRRRDPFDDPGLDPERARRGAGRRPADGPEDPEPDPEPPGGGSDAPGGDRGPTVGPASRRRPSNRPARRRPGPAHRPRRPSGPRRWWCPVSARAHRAGGRGRATAPAAPWRSTDVPARARRCTCSARCWRRPATSAERGPAAGAARRRAARGAGRAGGQSGDLRRRRIRVDGRARPDVRGRRRGAVAAARRLSASRQGRRDHLPRQRRRAAAAADVVGGHRRAAAGTVRHRRQDPAGRRACWRPATWCCARRRATVPGARWWWCSPTAGPPVGRTRWAGPGAAAGLLRRRGCRRRRGGLRDRPMCVWVWPRSWPGSCDAPAVRLAAAAAPAS